MEKKLHQRWSPLVYLQAMWTEKLREHLSVEKEAAAYEKHLHPLH
jgi:hypothetical protein